MIKKDTLMRAFDSAGIDLYGTTVPRMCDVIEEKHLPSFKVKGVAVAGVCYGAQRIDGVSSYACRVDYHRAIKEIARGIISEIKKESPEALLCCFCDVSPYDEVTLAVRAGLGNMGRNGLLMNSRYGSHVFIFEIACDDEMPDIFAADRGGCNGCGRCLDKCPTGAVSMSDKRGLCLSDITQKRGRLTYEERKLIKGCQMIWGCDICQDTCDANHIPAEAHPMLRFSPAFPQRQELERMSERQFRDAYYDRAYSWRGKATLLRNMDIIDENDDDFDL